MIKINLEIPEEIKKIVEVFKKNNLEIFLVGGCVRDLMLNKEPGD